MQLQYVITAGEGTLIDHGDAEWGQWRLQDVLCLKSACRDSEAEYERLDDMTMEEGQELILSFRA